MLDFSTITKEELQQLYNNNSILGVARELGVSGYKVEKKLQMFGIQKHSRNDSIIFGVRKIHGVDNVMQVDSVRQTLKESNLQKYGVECVLSADNIKEKISNTCMQRYGVFCSANIPGRAEKASRTTIDKYGKGNGNNRQKAVKTMVNKYGVQHALQNKTILKKQSGTCMKKYGVMYNCQTPQCNHRGSKYSKVNEHMYGILQGKFSTFEIDREFPLSTYLYDFHIQRYLIDVNPTITHNSDFSPFGDHCGIAKDYHRKKAIEAIERGYLPIFIYDWDDINLILNKLFTNSESDMVTDSVIEIDKCYQDYVSMGLLQDGWKDIITDNVVVYNIKSRRINNIDGYKVYTAGKLLIGG